MSGSSEIQQANVAESGSVLRRGTPKHRQILSILEERIRTGGISPGERFPTDAELVSEFGVSRPTVARAVSQLERKGLVRRRRGAGTFVRDREASSTERNFGLLIPGLGRTEIFEPICGEIARRAQSSNDSLIWGSDGKPIDAEGDDAESALSQCKRFVDRGLSGVFFAPIEMSESGAEINGRIVEMLAGAGIPIVLLDRDYVSYPDRSEYDLVGIDNRRVGWLVARHVLERGARRVMFVARPGSASTVDAREDGVRAAIQDTLGAELLNGRVDPADRESLEGLFGGSVPQAFICGNDATAARLLHTLESMGIGVPTEAMVAAFDDVRYAELLRVPLTTVHQPCEQLGRIAYEVMLQRLASPSMPPRDVLARCELVVRASTGGDKPKGVG